MSFDPLIKALEENPALAEELTNAKTPRERDAILDAHGIEKPGADEQFPEAGGAQVDGVRVWWSIGSSDLSSGGLGEQLKG